MTYAAQLRREPVFRDRMVSGIASLMVHGLIFLGGGTLLNAPVGYGVEAGEGGIAVHLIAALPASRKPVTETPSLADPGTATEASSQPNPTPAVGDSSSPVPGMDATTLLTEGGASGPVYARNPAPLYPELARAQGAEGTVVLKVEVLPSGRCGKLQIAESSGHTMLDEAAAGAVQRWRFRPATRTGTPVSVWVSIPVTFRLVDEERS